MKLPHTLVVDMVFVEESLGVIETRAYPGTFIPEPAEGNERCGREVEESVVEVEEYPFWGHDS